MESATMKMEFLINDKKRFQKVLILISVSFVVLHKKKIEKLKLLN